MIILHFATVNSYYVETYFGVDSYADRYIATV